MNVGFDLDKIFINHPPLSEKIIDKLHKKRRNGTLLYRIPTKIEQYIRLIAHYPPLRPSIQENLSFIKNLAKKNGDRHYLISGRFNYLKNKTDMLVKKYGLDNIFNGMFFNFHNEQPHFFKDTIIKKLHIDRYVDDDLDLLEFLAKRNPQTLFFWLNNKKHHQLNHNLFAITHLKNMFS